MFVFIETASDLVPTPAADEAVHMKLETCKH